MISTDSGKYAIRALTHMASQSNQDVPMSAANIAAAEDIPPYYLAKVLQDLARADLLKSVRGRGGGFLLKRPAKDIKVLAILEAVESIKRITTECVLGLDQCDDTVPCPLHETWKHFRENFLRRITEMTLEDLAVELSRKRA